MRSTGGLRLAVAATIVWILILFNPLTVSARQASPRPVTIDRALQQALKNGHADGLRVIIRTEPQRRDGVRTMLRRCGRRATREFASISGLVAVIDAEDVSRLATEPGVLGLSMDAIVTGDGTDDEVNLDLLPRNALYETLGLDGARYTGRNVGVAVVDSGIEKGPDLDARETGLFWDFTKGGRPAGAYDDYGHGTHVAGLIAGSGKASRVELSDGKSTDETRLYEGVAPGVRLVSLKALGDDGSGYTSDVLAAIEFVIENKARLGIDILNLSLGHPAYEPAEHDPLVLAVEQAVRAGIVVVASAGNVGRNPITGQTGYGGITSPGNAPSAITVGAFDAHATATRADDTVPGYSSRGPSWYDAFAKPDLVAPGHALVSVAAQNSWLFTHYPDHQVVVTQSPARYLRLSGTSMAAAVTSGVAALVLEASRKAHPEAPLQPNAVKAILEYTALPMPGYDYLTQGTGGLNAAGALALAAAIDPRAADGQSWLLHRVDETTTIDGAQLTWAQTIVWGNTVVWGNAVWDSASVWSNTVVWGNLAEILPR